MFKAFGNCLLVLTLLTILILGGCGGQEASPPLTHPTAVLPPAQRLAVLARISQQFTSLPHTDLAAENQALLTFLKAQPEVSTAGLAGGGVWCRFTDGTLHTIINNRVATPRSAVAAAEMLPRVRSGVPGPRRARLLRSMGTAFVNRCPTLRTWLAAAGYQVVVGPATIAALRNVSGDGIFYVDAHGAAGLRAADGTLVSGLWTSDPVDATTVALNAAEIADGSLVTATALQNADEPAVQHFMITAKFVRDHMSFGRNSFVYPDSCYLNAADFRGACLAKGASLYAGWTAPVADLPGLRATRFVFDRMLGANAYSLGEEPDQRPFDYQSVWDDLKARGWDTSVCRGFPEARLVFTPGATGDAGIFAPSIKFLTVNELGTTGALLEIAGLFGKDPGAANRAVTVGGQAATIRTWAAEKIVCDLPLEGAGSSGEVVVTSRGHASNKVPLTEWHGVFLYTHTDAPTLKYVIRTEVWIRADLHAFREAPHGTPVQAQVPFYASLRSKCTYACSGSAAADGNTETWSGSGAIPYTGLSWGTTFVNCLGSLDPQLRTVRLRLHAMTGTGLHRRMVEADNYTHTETDAVATAYPEDGSDAMGPYLNLPMDSNYNILAGQRTGQIDSQSNVDALGSATARLQWALLAATSPPTPGVYAASVTPLPRWTPWP